MRRWLITGVVALVGLGVGCTPTPTPPPPPPPIVDVPGTLVQGQTIAVETGAIERGGVDHNDGWIARSRTGGDSSGLTAAETTLTPRIGPGVAGLGTPQVLSPTVYPPAPGFLPLVVVTQPWLGDQLLLAGGATGAGPNQIFLNDGGTWVLAGTFAQDPAGETVEAFSDTQIVTCPASGANLRVYPVTTTGSSVVTGTAVTVPLPAGWSCTYPFSAEFDGPTLLMLGDDVAGPTTGQIATMDLSDPTTATPAVVWSTTAVAVDSADFDRSADGTTLRAAISADTLTGTPTKGRVVVVKQVGAGPWTTEKTLSAPAGLPDDSNGVYFGSRVAIDDDLIVTGARVITVPTPASTGTMGVAVLGGIRRTSSGWQHALSMTPAPAVITLPETGAMLQDIDVAGTVVSAEMFIGEEAAGPPAPFAAESWRFDAS